MEVLVERGAGIDVHKKLLVVCVMTTEGRTVVKTLNRFGTFPDELIEMREWLQQMRVTHVAMEATGEYWKPVYAALEGCFEVIVANAQHVKNVPGRKTDPEDAAWLARLLRHGLLRSSFVPPRPIRVLRDLTRMHRKMVQMRAQVQNRTEKVLEGAGIKLGSVMTKVFGATGQAIVRNLAANQTDPTALAQLAKGSLKKKKGEIARALGGTFSAHEAALLEHQLALYDQLTERIDKIEQQILEAAKPYEQIVDRLDAMPGVERLTAIEIIGEIGIDMSPWANHNRISAWAGVCPANHQSAGKRKNVGTRKGNPFLKAVLVQAATCAVKTKGTFYQAKFRRLLRRRGYKRAIVAIAHSMLIAIYHVIRDDKPYQELGAATFSSRDVETRKNALLRDLNRLGFRVELSAN